MSWTLLLALCISPVEMSDESKNKVACVCLDFFHVNSIVKATSRIDVQRQLQINMLQLINLYFNVHNFFS